MSQHDISRYIGDYDMFKEITQKYVETLIDTAEEYLKDNPEDSKIVEEKARKMLVSMLELENEIDGNSKAYKECQRQPAAGIDSKTIQDNYNNIVNAFKKPIPPTHDKIKKLNRKMWFAVRDDPFPGDDEDIIIEDKVSFNCPLTRKLFEDPVKSTVCGHTFSKQAIISYIGSNRKRKCPVAGCDRSFGKNDLEKDVETIHAMERHQTAMSEDSSDSDSGEFV